MATEAEIKAINKYNKEKTRCINLRLNLKTDADILEQLESVPSKMGYIKELIRRDIEKKKKAITATAPHKEREVKSYDIDRYYLMKY